MTTEGLGRTKGTRQRLHGSVAREIGVGILSGRYPPKHGFPGEIEFSEQLQISRTALREAMRILSAKGLVESRPKAGTHVTPKSRWNLLDPDVLAWQFEAEPSKKFLHDLFELRMMVEPSAAELAAQRCTDAQIAQMKQALDEMARHGLATEAGRAADRRFHTLIIEAANNEPLMALSSFVSASISWTTIFKQRRRMLPRDPLPEHRRLYETIANRNPSAARDAMTVLINLALNDTEVSLEDD